jgi:hypothetical protein
MPLAVVLDEYKQLVGKWYELGKKVGYYRYLGIG